MYETQTRAATKISLQGTTAPLVVRVQIEYFVGNGHLPAETVPTLRLNGYLKDQSVFSSLKVIHEKTDH